MTFQHNDSTQKTHIATIRICKHKLLDCPECRLEIDYTERDATPEEIESLKKDKLMFKLYKIEREEGLKSKLIKFTNGYQRVFYVDHGHGEPQ